MKSKITTILFIICFSTLLHAQREAGIWYFGIKAGIDFNSGAPVALNNGLLITQEGCATISDKNGNLLFYTDGSTIWNANHKTMPNGSGLLGHSSSTQSAIIVPNPLNPKIYYIFTVDQPNDKNADGNVLTNVDDKSNDGLNYTEVNMSLNGGLGDVNPLKKNIHLITYNPNNAEEAALKCSEKITAVQHNDGNSYWVVTHFTDSFYAFNVTASGVQETPVKTVTNTEIYTGGYLPNAIGYLKSSPNGKKLAISHLSIRQENTLSPKDNKIVRNTGKAYLYDFNSTTGEVSNQISLLSQANPYGVEFSSKSKKLYLTTNNYNNDGTTAGSTLYQYDLENSNVAGSKTIISKNEYVSGALQLAIDEKIYRAGYKINTSSGDFLSVINNPEALGTACNFKESTLNLGGGKSLLGLPPFIQSLFLFNFSYEFTCLGDFTHFFINTLEPIDSVLWDFGDGNTSTDIDAYHQYSMPGTYTVSITKTVNGETKDPLTKEVIIQEKPVVLTSTYQLIQCDSYDSDPSDELAVFNLENSIDAITLNKAEDYNVFFYLNDIDAENDLYNENSLPFIYKNTAPNQILTAKIIYKNSDCASYAKVELIANSSILMTTDDIIGCDLGDATAEFDFTLKENQIISNINLSSNFKIYFYENEDDVINQTNEITGLLISPGKKIFFRAEENGVCYGSGTFNLLIGFFPDINLEEILTICDNNFPVNISATIDESIQSNYDYKWSNEESTHDITINTPQQISVTITDKVLLCERTKTYTIEKVTTPIIENVTVDINSLTATVFTNTNFENEYTLDNPYNTYQSENIFTNLTPGVHTVYAKNKYSCDISSKLIYVLGFPKFFTPNNDGFNDTWQIEGINSEDFTYSEVNIFDRFGKLIATLNPNDSWSGIYNGKLVGSSDYWFTISVINSENYATKYRGHFSLLRN